MNKNDDKNNNNLSKSVIDDDCNIDILKKDEDWEHFLINIVNTISTYSQLIKLCVNEKNGTHENAEKIKEYSKKIKNNSEYLAKLLHKMDIKKK